MTRVHAQKSRAAKVAIALGCVSVMTSAMTGCSSDDVAPVAEPSPTTSSETAALPQADEPVTLDPATFTTTITNPYWPMEVGDQWVYQEIDGEGGVQRVEVSVLDETKTVAAGIVARVVHDVVTEDGQLVEDTYDWYAQDSVGNIWYLGEDTKEYADGEVTSTAGSWEAGANGAQPGILIPADPQPGMTYRQEYLAGEAEDAAAVLSISELVETPTGLYTDALMTRDTTALEPALAELKFYALGLGPVLVVQTAGGAARETLVQTTRTSP